MMEILDEQVSVFHPKRTLNCRGRLLVLEQPVVMGIINLTPDSFYDGGRLKTNGALLEQCARMVKEGAVFLDLGAQSSRPGSEAVSESEELQRLLPALELVLNEFPETYFSIDTYRAAVAREAIEAGAHLINDISAGTMDSAMLDTAAELRAPYILMHMQGNPATMQQNPHYESVTQEVNQFFQERVQAARAAGIHDIVLDPGFGFGKTVEHNYRLLHDLDQFRIFDCPLLIGLSRKSMINKVLKTKPENALNGTTAAHTLGLLRGANILRVHDVKEAVQTIRIVQAFTNSGQP